MTLCNYSENYLHDWSIEKHFNSSAQTVKESTQVTHKESFPRTDFFS